MVPSDFFHKLVGLTFFDKLEKLFSFKIQCPERHVKIIIKVLVLLLPLIQVEMFWNGTGPKKTKG